MAGRSTWLLAVLLLQLLSVPAWAGESNSEPQAACNAQQGTCSSLVQRNATRMSRTALEVKEKPEPKKSIEGPARSAKVATEEQVNPILQKAKYLAHRATLSLLHAGRIMGPTSDTAGTSSESGGSSWFLFILTTLMVLALIAAGLGCLMYQDKRYRSAFSESSAARPSTATASMGPSVAGGSYARGGTSTSMGSKAAMAAPRPAESRGPSTMPRGSMAEPRPSNANPSLHLCPELVVPDMTECTLFVPRLTNTKSNAQLSIDDQRGVSVFRAEINRSATTDGTRLVLASPAGDVIFASCRDSRPRVAFSICGKDGREFCSLKAKDDGSFEVVTNSIPRQQLRFQGQGASGPSGMMLNAYDDQSNLLALSDPDNDGTRGVPRQRVRIGPLLDAGLFVICYLSIDLLQMDREKTPTFSSSRFG